MRNVHLGLLLPFFLISVGATAATVVVKNPDFGALTQNESAFASQCQQDFLNRLRSANPANKLALAITNRQQGADEIIAAAANTCLAAKGIRGVHVEGFSD